MLGSKQKEPYKEPLTWCQCLGRMNGDGEEKTNGTDVENNDTHNSISSEVLPVIPQ